MVDEADFIQEFMNSEARKLARDLQRMLKTNRYNLLYHGATLSQHTNLSTLILEISALQCKDEQLTIHIPCEQGAAYDTILDECYTRITQILKQDLNPREYPNKITLEFYDPTDTDLSEELSRLV